MVLKTFFKFFSLSFLAISIWIYYLLNNSNSRLHLIFNAFKKLYYIKDEEVDRFMRSYDLFSQDKVNDENESMIIDYYHVLNYLCALGEVEKMYIPPVIDKNLGVFDNQIEYEKIVMKYIGASKGKKLLDLGCGRGGVASHIAYTTGAHITGINIDSSQLETAKERAKKLNITEITNFIHHSFNSLPLPFDDNSFDGIYNIQALTYVKDYDKLFLDLYRILKPGSRISLLDWFIYEYDKNNSTHVDLMKKCKPMIGAVYEPTPLEWQNALEKAGFIVEINENASIDSFQYTLIEAADYYFTSLHIVVKVLVKIGVLPEKLGRLFDRLTQDANSFIIGDKLRLWSSCHQIVALKPIN